MKYNKIIKVVGITFVMKNKSDLWNHIKLHDRVHLETEKENIYNSHAVKVIYLKTKIGYIPRNENKILFDLIEENKELDVQVIDKFSTPLEKPVIKLLIQEK